MCILEPYGKWCINSLKLRFREGVFIIYHVSSYTPSIWQDGGGISNDSKHGLLMGLHLNNSFIYFRLEYTCHLVKPRSHLSTKGNSDLTTSMSPFSSDASMSPMILSCLFFLALPSSPMPIPQLLWSLSRMIHGPDQLHVHGQFKGSRIRFSMEKYTS
jgi:hypothetical protein